MKGHVISFSVQEDSGIISGANDQRYTFTASEWMADITPKRGMAVDFDFDGGDAKGVYLALPARSKSKVTAGVLALLLGWLGAHKFYLGYTVPALTYLLFNTVGLLVTWIFIWLPNIALGVIALTEGIIYLTATDEHFEATYVHGRKSWF